MENKIEKLRRVLDLRLGLSLTWKKVDLLIKDDTLTIMWSQPKKPPFSFHSKEIALSEIDRVLRQQVNKLNNERDKVGDPNFSKLV